jgi:hypothetical protein
MRNTISLQQTTTGMKVLQQLPKFNPMVDGTDRSLEYFAEDFDCDKKQPGASVNKIGAPIGALLK